MTRNRSRDERRRQHGTGTPALTPTDKTSIGKLEELGAAKSHDASNALRLAAALAIDQNPARAAELAGIEYRSRADLARLEALARTNFPDICRGDPGAAKGALGFAGAMLAAEIVARASSIPAAVLGTSMRSITDAQLKLGGGLRPTYSKVALVVRGPKGETVRVGWAAEKHGVAAEVIDASTVKVTWPDGSQETVRKRKAAGK